MSKWAENEPTVKALIIIGSRERKPSEVIEAADAFSDWDFHIVSSDPEMFTTSLWTRRLSGCELKAYSVRTAIIGGVPKVAAVFSGAEADFVIIPARLFYRVRLGLALRIHKRDGWTKRRLQDIAEVIRPGWRFLKGADTWGRLYQRAILEVQDPRLSDNAARQLAENFVCDYVWVMRKLSRGELRTAQRTLYQELFEVNLKLLHELKQRRNQRSFTKARRIERIATPEELAAISIEAKLEASELHAAVEKSATTCRALMKELVGGSWHWPDLR